MSDTRVREPNNHPCPSGNSDTLQSAPAWPEETWTRGPSLSLTVTLGSSSSVSETEVFLFSTLVSQLGTILPPGDVWHRLEADCWLSQLGRGGCRWHLVGGGQARANTLQHTGQPHDAELTSLKCPHAGDEKLLQTHSGYGQSCNDSPRLCLPDFRRDLESSVYPPLPAYVPPSLQR